MLHKCCASYDKEKQFKSLLKMNIEFYIQSSKFKVNKMRKATFHKMIHKLVNKFQINAEIFPNMKTVHIVLLNPLSSLQNFI